jgi:hypothetical protein
MTPLGLTVLRRTATLAHAVPGLRVRLRHDGITLLEVLRPAHPVVAPPGRWLTPCGFRMAVGRALQAAQEGRTLAVLGLPAGVDPAVDVAATCGELLPGGIAVVPVGPGLELAFSTTVRAEAIAAMAHVVDLDVHCHTDRVTQACLVVHACSAPSGSPEFTAVLEHARDLLARCAVHELVDHPEAFLHTTSVQAEHEPTQDRRPRS